LRAARWRWAAAFPRSASESGAAAPGLASGGQSGLHIRESITDEEGMRQVQVGLLGSQQDQPGQRFTATAMLLRKMRASENAIDPAAIFAYFFLHALVYFCGGLFGHQAAANGGLVADDNTHVIELSQSTQGIQGAGQESEFFPTLDVIRPVIADYPIAIQEDGFSERLVVLGLGHLIDCKNDAMIEGHVDVFLMANQIARDTHTNVDQRFKLAAIAAGKTDTYCLPLAGELDSFDNIQGIARSGYGNQHIARLEKILQLV